MSVSRGLVIDKSSKIAFAEQIFKHYSEAVRSGTILFGTKLASIRELAAELKINKIAVVNAYEKLMLENPVASRPGSGFYVSFKPRRTDTLWLAHGSSWEDRHITNDSLIAGAVERAVDSCVSHIMPRGADSGAVTQLGAAQIVGDQIPLDDLRSAARHVLQVEGISDLGCEHPLGILELRKRIAADLELRGINVEHEDHVLVTGGTTQALDLLLQTVTQPGDTVAAEVPGFALLYSIFMARQLQLVELPRGFETIDLSSEAEAELLRRRPRVFVTTPAFHNPTGGTLSMREKHRLLRLAEECGALVVELDLYHGLHFGEMVPIALSSLDGLRRTVYISGFTRFLAPGLRVSYMAASGEMAKRLLVRKMVLDIEASSLDQSIVCEFIAKGFLRKHLTRIREVLRSRRNTIVAMLRRLAPQGSSFQIPEGGVYLWFEFPPGPDIMEVHRLARERGVEIAPSSLFFPTSGSSRHMRINFAMLEPVRIYDGLETVFAIWRTLSSKMRAGN